MPEKSEININLDIVFNRYECGMWEARCKELNCHGHGDSKLEAFRDFFIVLGEGAMHYLSIPDFKLAADAKRYKKKLSEILKIEGQ